MSARLRALVALPALLASVLTAAVATDAATAPTASAATHHKHHGHHHGHHKHHGHQQAAPKIARARHIAMKQLGDPYKWGATGPNAFDCSGLVYYSYRHAGVSVPRTAAEQSGRARHIAKSNMRSGDLMFFNDGSGVYHVAIFLHWGSGHRAVMVQAPRPGEHVQVARTWTSHWFGGTLRGR